MNEDIEICDDCGQIKNGDIIFHLLYCFDVYIVSPPCPLSSKQNQIDIYLHERIVKPLEQKGYKCFFGSRNITGGDHIIQAMSSPITIIPTTIVPVYEDKKFSSLRNLLLRPDYLNRIVYLLFDRAQCYPDVVVKNSYSISINDSFLLQKLIQTIEQNRGKTPLHQRRRKYEMGPYSVSSVASNSSETGIERNSRSFPFDIFRKGHFFQDRDRVDSHGSRMLHEEDTPEILLSPEIQMQQSRRFSTAVKMGDDICLKDPKSKTPPDVLLCHCNHDDKKISHFAARSLTKEIQKDIGAFYRNTSLLRFETQVRTLLERDYMTNCEMNCYMEKLYFWILAAIYIRIYKCNDRDLKYHMKALTLKWYKTSPKQLYQNFYLKLTNSIIARIKDWSKRLEKNDAHVQMLENCISLLDQSDFQVIQKSADVNTVVKYLIQLPWDIKHIFVVIITEKIFEKKYTEPYMQFFYEICASVKDKHQEMYLDLVERATEYIQENYTKGALSLKLLKVMWDLIRDGKSKDEKLMTVLKHFFKKLVYHPVTDVRNFVTLLLFSEDVNGIDMCQLGSSCVLVDGHLLETCIRKKLSLNYPDMILHDQIPTTAENFLLFDAKMPDGDTLVHVFRQKTINDILLTNSTDSAYERFQEVSKAMTVCQKHRNIVTLKNCSSNGVLPLFMVEHGKPLLQYLHEKENRLTWSQMLEILIDITSAVQHCHENSIILCDITPASFIVTSGPDGFSITKLSSLLYSKYIPQVENDDSFEEYIGERNSICIEGEYKQPLAAYFSAPETLTGNFFSKSTEVWMLGATFYSVLLYGRQPFEELSHLSTSLFVREITSHHIPQRPVCFLPELWKILSTNLNHKIGNRMSIQSILEELHNLKSTLGENGDGIYHVRSVCPCINSEDIQMVYRDLEGKFIEEKEKELTKKIHRDYYRRQDRLYEIVSVRMGQKTRKTIKTLNHVNILPVEEITTDSYTTKLVSVPFDLHSKNFKRNDCSIDLDHLLSYFEQMVTALQYLHSQNILHCDLRCCYMYVDPNKGTLKLGHFGRAVLLEKNQYYVLKVMPYDGGLWSAQEVKEKGMYSRASDIFNLASVFWEALNTLNKILPSLQDKRTYENLEEPSDSWQYCINNLMPCLKECWNINPTKRPTLDDIDKVIKQLKRENQRWSVEEICPNPCSSEDNGGEVYEDITTRSHNHSSSIAYVWKDVVNELESYPKMTYENVRTVCWRTRKDRALTL